ncbi:MAG: peroxiredoxin [Actinomycetota bacterium]|nr:peroxiredoxin [Actinomycetota bacterium]
MTVDIGAQAPDFELHDQNNQVVRLSSYRGGKNVVLVFYPLAFTGTCQTELRSIRDDLPSLENDAAQVLAVSVDSVFSHKVWADQQGFEFPLLADFWPHGEVAKRYGVFNDERGVALRGTFIIDREGVVRHRVVNAMPDARDHAEYVRVLASL